MAGSYVQCLTTLNDVFIQQLKQQNILTKEAIEGVFLNIEEILSSHLKLLEKLENRMKVVSSSLNVGDIFLEAVSPLRKSSLISCRFLNSDLNMSPF